MMNGPPICVKDTAAVLYRHAIYGGTTGRSVWCSPPPVHYSAKPIIQEHVNIGLSARSFFGTCKQHDPVSARLSKKDPMGVAKRNSRFRVLWML